jgi:hypothetical protein
MCINEGKMHKNEGSEYATRGGEWEPIKILTGTWPISQNQSDVYLF